MEAAVASLKDGTAKEHIQKTLDILIAGEQNAKWVHFYSGLSAKLPNKLHVFVMGNSQMGKSFMQTQLINHLFNKIAIDVANFTKTSFFYKAHERKDPEILKDKIIRLDEFFAISEDGHEFIKKLTSSSPPKEFLYETLDDKRKPLSLIIRGVPVVWTSSMQMPEDIGDQKLNRFFKVNIDESLAQSRRVEEFQIEQEVCGEQYDLEALEMAQWIIFYVFQKKNYEEKDFDIKNPFAPFLRQIDFRVGRNVRPMFNALLRSVTFLNWMRRPRFPLPGGRSEILLSSLSDNLEALAIWRENEKFQKFKLPERYLKVCRMLAPGEWMIKEELAKAYKEKYGVQLSEGTMYLYARELCDRGILISRIRIGAGKSQEYGLGDNSNDSNIAILELRKIDRDLLARQVKKALRLILIENGSTQDIEGIVSSLIDADIPRGPSAQVTLLDDPAKNRPEEPGPPTRIPQDERARRLEEILERCSLECGAAGRDRLSAEEVVEEIPDELVEHSIDQDCATQRERRILLDREKARMLKDYADKGMIPWMMMVDGRLLRTGSRGHA